MLELIAIHIPKTAGKSFVAILRSIYGEENVFWSGRDDTGKVLLEFEKAGLENMPKVLSGHFSFRQVSRIYRSANVPLVTWLRDPIERVISDYFFFIMRIQSGLNRKNVHRWNETLLEFACLPECRNRMSKFLDGIKLKEVFFFGLAEHFDEDFQEMRRRLGWPAVEPVYINSNRDFRSQFSPIPPENIEQLKKWNKEDIELYREACSLRNARCGQVFTTSSPK